MTMRMPYFVLTREAFCRFSNIVEGLNFRQYHAEDSDVFKVLGALFDTMPLNLPEKSGGTTEYGWMVWVLGMAPKWVLSKLCRANGSSVTGTKDQLAVRLVASQFGFDDDGNIRDIYFD